MTHYLPKFAVPSPVEGLQQAVCGTIITAGEHSPEPTCAKCLKYIMEGDTSEQCYKLSPVSGIRCELALGHPGACYASQAPARTPIPFPLRDRVYQTAVRQMADDRRIAEQPLISPSLKAPVTEIVRDMRQMARELGLVALLLEHQRIESQPDRTYELVAEVLIRLGVTNTELLENMKEANS